MDVLGARMADFCIGDHRIAAIIADGSQRQMAHEERMGWHGSKKLMALLVK